MSSATTEPGDASQVTDEPHTRTATIRLTLDIRNNSQLVRGRKRAIEHIEFWGFCRNSVSGQRTRALRRDD